VQHRLRTRPFAHQTKARERMAGRRAFALLMEMGTGKSWVLLDDIVELFALGEIDGALIAAGKGSYTTWTRSELPTHMPSDLDWSAYLWTGADSAADRQQRRAILATDPASRSLRIVVMNTEAIGSSPRAMKFALDFVRSGRVLMAVDESTMIRNHTSRRFENCRELGQLATHRRILTGSPVANSPLDIWGQFEFLEHGLLGYRSFYAWRARYAIMHTVDMGPRKIPVVQGYQNLEELHEIVSRHSYRVTKDECLDLPPKVMTEREVATTDQQQAMYDSMRRMALAELDSGEVVVARSQMGVIMRLHQILCGWLPDGSGGIRRIDSNRIASLVETLEESGLPAIVWCAYRADVAAIRTALDAWCPGQTVEYHGGTSREDRIRAVESFQAGRARFFVSTLATGSRGTTLTAAGLVVYFSNSFDLEYRLQSEDRAHRIGQLRSVTYVDLVVRGTVDERIVTALRKKQSVADIITGDSARSWLL
jgi:SNF2 family DNA or RNA helicase